MAFDLLNRAYTVGTIDGAQDITPGVAQTGFRDFSTISSSDTTFLLAAQGSKWAYMTVSKVGAVLRPGTYHDGSNGEGASVTFDAGTITVFSDLGWQHIVYNDASGNAQNAEGVLRSFSPETLADLKTTPLPSSGKTVSFLRGILADDQKGAFYVWDPDETATGDDFTYVVSSLSATGRWVRQTNIMQVPNLANDAAAYSGSLYGVSDDLRHKESTGIVKKVFRGETYHQGEYITFAAWKAIASTQWTNGDTFVFRGITAENDLGGQYLVFKWDASSTNTDALDVIAIRPDDISGSNAGRAVLVEPSAMAKFADSDATPTMKTGRFHRCADTAPAAITALDDMVDLQPHWIFPGAQAQVFTHGASLKCPSASNFTLGVNDSPVMAVSDNGVVSIISGGLSAARLASTASGEGAALVGYKHTGTSTAARTVYSVLNEYVQAEGYTGFAADGSTDCQAALANAITDVAGTGKKLVLPNGVIRLNSALPISDDFVHIMGQGRYQTIIRPNGNFAACFDMDTDAIKCELSNFQIDTLTTTTRAVRCYGLANTFRHLKLQTSGAVESVNIQGSYNQFDDVSWETYDSGIACIIESHATEIVISNKFEGCEVGGTGSGFITRKVNAGGRPEGTVLSNCDFICTGGYQFDAGNHYGLRILGCGFEEAPTTAIRIHDQCDRVQIIGGSIGTSDVDATHLVFIESDSGHVDISNAWFRGGDVGIWVNAASGAYVDGVSIRDNTFEGQAEQGIHLDSAVAEVIGNRQLTGDYIYGFLTTNGTHTSHKGKYVYGDNQLTTLGTALWETSATYKRWGISQQGTDDDASGTFTPVLEFGGATTGITYTTQEAYWERKGDVVFFTAQLTLSSKGTATGGAKIGGLPFAHASGPDKSVVNVSYTGMNSVNPQIWGEISATESEILIVGNSGAGLGQLQDTAFTNSSILTVTGHYHA